MNMLAQAETGSKPAVSARQIEICLRQALQPHRLEVIDESHQHAGHAGTAGLGGGTHFRLRIASPFFTGKRRVEQHRLVYDALQQFMAQGLHALAIEIFD